MVRWDRLFNLTGQRDGYHYHDEIRHLLPSHGGDVHPSTIPPKEVTKVALRLKFLIEEIIPCELEAWKVTKANSPVLTHQVQLAAKEAGGDKYRGCVVYCLLVCKRWFKRQAVLELWDAEMHQVRATACEVLAKLLIESEANQDYLLQELLLRRYSILRNGEETVPANALERAVDLHALRVIGSSGYQKCIAYLWRGWLIQDDEDAAQFVEYQHKDQTDYWVHFHPARLRAPVYQNAVQIFFSILYLVLYSQVINTINVTGDIDSVEVILYIFTLGFTCDEVSKVWKVGRYYVGFWNVFNCTLYVLLAVSFIARMIALSTPMSEDPESRHRFNELGYNFLAFSAPMFWLRLLLYLDSFRFFGAMLVVMKVMMQESLIFFALLLVVMLGFLQAFVGMDNIDSNAEATLFIVQAMLNSVMQSPDFSGFENFAPPFGIILYYIFTFIVMVVLLNILVALYNSAYADITDNATDEYMALFAQKTMQFVRAPDENVFIAPFNLIEIFLLILPFEWWIPSRYYTRLNDVTMTVIYAPLLVITSALESRQARQVKWNRSRGEADDDTLEEWEELGTEVDLNLDSHELLPPPPSPPPSPSAPSPSAPAGTTSSKATRERIREGREEGERGGERGGGGGGGGEREGGAEEWQKKVKSVAPDVTSGMAVQEVRKLAEEVGELKAHLGRIQSLLEQQRRGDTHASTATAAAAAPAANPDD
ncbi:MAG: hypothetical protein M1838_000175 [Thelocarpon superellum]|nr:MAG: hypothetical protein M1838_000175 [Thelocarpon superellum]